MSAQPSEALQAMREMEEARTNGDPKQVNWDHRLDLARLRDEVEELKRQLQECRTRCRHRG